HAELAGPLIREAFQRAGVTPESLEAIAFAQGPGLGPCLRTGATAARALSLRLGIPLVGVNHCVAHLEIGRGTTGAKDPLLLYASGGNTQVIAYAQGRYRVFGETLDVGIGNMLDKFARDQGIPFPGGPKLETLARDGRRLLELPYPVKGMDTAFSGVLTAANAWIKRGASLADVAFSVQETCFAALTEVTERALAQTDKREVLLGGGVACNDRLADMVRTMAADRGIETFRPEKALLVDNGAMIAWNGLVMHRQGAATPLGASGVNQRYRTDQVEAVWLG
ncbi:MAG: tRNA (adenosine(37)-N6)-threonylcarbamoyltransferase complex transferase subunit TsaD, partial [Euryarchaeota archaeon]|nr:tRNA (adenosine(37)-N6)-threonylcarbamoyltransferase complex transferase subunit TsaD [Euryarchaeota archaeon]